MPRTGNGYPLLIMGSDGRSGIMVAVKVLPIFNLTMFQRVGVHVAGSRGQRCPVPQTAVSNSDGRNGEVAA
jgi:hypothetical protein